MKKVKYAILAAALVLSVVGCMKTEQNYTPNPQYPGDNLYFPADAPTKVELDKDQPLQFDINVYRGGDTTDPLDATLAITGEAIDENFVTIESAVAHFAAGESTAKITATVDGDKLGLNKTTTFTVAIADESQTSPVGDASLTYSVIIPLPWLVFDSGILTESPGWWGETEAKTLYYQEVSPTLWLCKLPQCWGHDTMEGGKEYDCQDYMFYWDKNTNYLYVCYGYMGYMDEVEQGPIPICVATYADLLIGQAYLAKQSTVSPEDIGTEDWFAVQDYYLNGVYGPAGRPHYDGNGIFYLGDSYICDMLMYDGAAFGYAYTMKDTPDTFVCDSFEHFDYTTTIKYKGFFVSPKDEAVPVIEFTGGADVKGVKYVLTDDDKADLATVIASIVDGTAEGIVDVELTDGEATDNPEIDPGVWIAVAVPYDADGVLHGDYAAQMKFNFKGLNPTPAVENLVEGYYSYECDNPNEGVLTLSAVDATNYTVSGLGIGNGIEWNAVYDKANGTLTMDGTINGHEQDGNMFYYPLGPFNPSEGTVYTLESYGKEGSGKDPIVFDVDTSTGELTAVHPEIYVSVYLGASGEYVGDYNTIEDGATVEFLAAPQTTSVTLARGTSKQSAKPVLMKSSSSNVRTHKHSVKNVTMAPQFGYWNGLSKAKPGLKDCRALIK